MFAPGVRFSLETLFVRKNPCFLFLFFPSCRFSPERSNFRHPVFFSSGQKGRCSVLSQTLDPQRALYSRDDTSKKKSKKNISSPRTGEKTTPQFSLLAKASENLPGNKTSTGGDKNLASPVFFYFFVSTNDGSMMGKNGAKTPFVSP